ncbi:MAG: isoleucine--tRNA ligase [Anaerolineales bacterium]
MFKAVNSQVDIPATEKEILDYWRAQNIFQRSMDERQGNPSYVFYEGPPTANGRPGSHHLISRAFKDMFPRYHTMRGRYVLRKGGWDTHGLPVEIEVQKQLGIEFKHEVEETVGIAKFNEMCKESVFKYIQEWEDFTERIAFWVSLDDAYVTYHNEYIQSVWWILKKLWDKGLIYQGYKVVPYCPVCGTPLSSHEVSLGYEEVDDPSAYVRFKVKGIEDTYFLAWTTTPWTLPGNVALAVGPQIEYVLAEGRQSADAPTERVYVAKSLVEAVLQKHSADDGGYEIIETLKGTDLIGMHYEPLYSYLPVEGDYAYVTGGDFVSLEDGTGIVHMAPAFGADDMEIGQREGLPVLVTVNEQGKFIPEVEIVAGLWFKDADKIIRRDLRDRNLMFHEQNYLHNYPHCWRSKNPLMYYARDTWYIRTTEYRDKLVELNNTIKWVPDHVRTGRFGRWLEDVKDWALGRERFWGTPLPVWVCDNPEIEHSVCIGSVAELEEYTGRDLSELDLHRPYVDDITWGVEIDGKKGTMRRVPEVIDVWFDSGAMPFAQWGYPFDNQQQFEAQYPADYICEAVDQTRGWFYSLHAISTLLEESVAYKNVICLGHILGADGKKMSKSRPETFVAPWDILDQYGADAFRWYMYVSAPPGEARVLALDKVGDVVRSFYLTLWNVFSFFTTYAELDGFDPHAAQVPLTERDALDRWVLGELNILVEKVTAAFDDYDATNATRPIETFVDDLSNWYLRRSRRRFWRTDNDQDKRAAYQTLYECLVTVAKLIAPTMPFLADKLYLGLVRDVDPNAPDSVHLTDWPTADPGRVDDTLVEEMRLAKRLVSLGHSARNASGVRVRQPLAEAAFGVPSTHDADVVRRMQDLIAEELNVKAVKVLEATEGLVEYKLKPVDALGRQLRGDFPAVRNALVNADPAQVAAWGKRLMSGEKISVAANGKSFDLGLDEIVVQQTGAEGYAVAENAGYLAALQTELSEELVQEGLAREVVRRIQTLRKDSGLDISDRIQVVYDASPALKTAIERFAGYITGETLADSLTAGQPTLGQNGLQDDFDNEKLSLSLAKTE